MVTVKVFGVKLVSDEGKRGSDSIFNVVFG